MKKFKISTQKKTFRHGGAAKLHATHKHPGVVWGNWHQGPNGRMRVVGKIPGREADDPIIVEEV